MAADTITTYALTDLQVKPVCSSEQQECVTHRVVYMLDYIHRVRTTPQGKSPARSHGYDHESIAKVWRRKLSQGMMVVCMVADEVVTECHSQRNHRARHGYDVIVLGPVTKTPKSHCLDMIQSRELRQGQTVAGMNSKPQSYSICSFCNASLLHCSVSRICECHILADAY